MTITDQASAAAALTATTYRAILTRQANYFTSVWPGLKAGTYPGTGPITLDLSTAETTELSVRGAAAVAQALTTAWRAGILDPEPVLAVNALTLAGRLVAAVAASHCANKTTGPRWSVSNQWQEGYWAGIAATAALLLDGTRYLPATTRTQITAMVTAEADRITAASPPVWTAADGTVLSPGNSRAEECQWNTVVLTAAAALDPGNSIRDLWISQAVRYAIVGNAHPSDLTNPGMLNGHPVAAWTGNGWNLRPDYLVTNHGRPVHPDYSACGTLPIQAALLLALACEPAPVGLIWNVARVNNALQTVPFTGGKTIYQPGQPGLYYPYGNDWGSRTTPNFLPWDGTLAALDLDLSPWGGVTAPHPAAYWEGLRLAEVWAMQNRPTTSTHREGWVYNTDPATQPPEMIYRIREEDVFYKASLPVLARHLAPAVAWHNDPV